MRKSFLWMLVWLLVAASGSITLIGCGDHDGGGGGGGVITGAGAGGGAATFTQGIITNASGSTVTVNGIDFDTSTANIMINGNTGSAGDLKPGKFVTIKGSVNGTSGSATDIECTNQMLGPVTEKTGTVTSNPISSATATITMFGQTIMVDGNTQFEPADQDLNSITNGSKVEVSGMPDSTGGLLATLMESRPTTTFYSVRGVISDVTGSTFTLRPNGGNGEPLTVTLGPGATISQSGLGTGGTGTAGGAGGMGTGGTGTTGGLGTGGTGTAGGAGGMGTGGTGTTGGLGTGGTGTTGAGGMGTGGTGTTGTGGATGQIQQVACPASGTTDVTIQDFSYSPATITIAPNTIVKWTNNGPSLHTVTGTTSGQFDSGNINAGSSVCFNFPATGTFNYFCTLHPFMTGSVTVQGTSGSLGTGGTGTAGGAGGTGGTGAGGMGAATLQNGQTVTVRIDPAAYQTGSTSITATSVTIQNMLLPADNDIVFLEGFPTDISGSTFKVGGISVNAGTQTMPSEGQRIAVHGVFSNGTVMADFIQPAAAANLTMGAITSISATTGTTVTAGTGSVTMIVNGTTFDISAAQIKMNGQPANITDLLPGKQVIVKSASTNFASIFSQTTGTGGLGTGGTGTTGGTGGLGTGGTGTTDGTGGLGTGGTGTTGTGSDGTGTGGTTGTGSGGTAPGSGGSYLTGHGKTSETGGTGGTGTGGTGTTGGTGGTGTGGTGTTGGTGGLGTGGTGTTGGTGGLGTGGTGTTGGLGTGGTGTTGAGPGGAGAGAVVKANAVWIIDNVLGPASELSGSLSSGTSGTSNAAFTVFGLTIRANGSTKLGPELTNLMSTGTGSLAGLTTGAIIEASGTSSNGDLLATFIESRATTTEYHVRGLVSGLTGSPVSTFTLTPVPGGDPVTVSLASSVTMTNIADGMTVDVKIDPASYSTGATAVTAQAVDPVREPVPAESDMVNIEGVVSDLSGDTFTVGGFEVDASAASMTGVANGSKVRVQGAVSGGTIKAQQIQIL